MPRFTKLYVNSGFRIKVAADNKHFLNILNDYCGQAKRGQNGNAAFKIGMEISCGVLPRAFKQNQPGVLRYENSLIDIKNKKIRSYYPRISKVDQAGILLRPLWCFLNHLGFYPLHGALIKRGEKFLTFMGPAGSGKSTFAFLLAQRGFTLICDDHFFIKEEGNRLKVAPFAKNIKIRSIEKKIGFKINSEKINQQKIPAFYFAKEFFIIFPRYSSGDKTVLRRISNKEGALRLIYDNFVLKTGQADNRMGQMNLLNFFARLEKKSRFFELIYDDSHLAEAAALILDVRRSGQA